MDVNLVLGIAIVVLVVVLGMWITWDIDPEDGRV
jgi:hypothetical protein